LYPNSLTALRITGSARELSIATWASWRFWGMLFFDFCAIVLFGFVFFGVSDPGDGDSSANADGIRRVKKERGAGRGEKFSRRNEKSPRRNRNHSRRNKE